MNKKISTDLIGDLLSSHLYFYANIFNASLFQLVLFRMIFQEYRMLPEQFAQFLRVVLSKSSG